MASCSSVLSEEQFQCSICLEVFTMPVSIQCGHTFCKTCITKYWDNSHPCQCPMCKKTFDKRPDLFVNIFIAEMAAEFRKSVQERRSSSSISSPDEQPARPGDVSCDICTGKNVKAIKSCMVCQTSYCEMHLEPHFIGLALRKHTLVAPVENLEDRICKKHERPLELFCRTDQACVCRFCSETDHKTHVTVRLEKEYRERKDELRKKEAGVELAIQRHEQKIKQIKGSVDMGKKEAKREIAHSVEDFAALVASIQRIQAELIEVIEERQRAAEEQAEGLIKELEREISDLKKRSTELEQLSHIDDHFHFLQSFLPHSTPSPPTKDWSKVRVHMDLSVERVRRAMAQLEETLAKEMETLPEVKLKRVRQYAVDVTLNPDTAHPTLVLSVDGKQVEQGDVDRSVPWNAGRFDHLNSVLGRQGFSGRFYYEVQVADKTEWTLGVVKESIKRTGSITVRPKYGYWVIRLLNGDEYYALENHSVRLSLKAKPQVIGVFVDYKEGQVSFYDVVTKVHIYSYTGCVFTERLYPYLSPRLNEDGENAAPLIICSFKRQHSDG